MTPKGSEAVCGCPATKPLCHGGRGYGHPQALVACGISMWLGLQGPSELPLPTKGPGEVVPLRKLIHPARPRGLALLLLGRPQSLS